MKIPLILLIAPLCLSVKLPSSLKKCNRKDPHFDVCLREAIQHAFNEHGQESIPEINLPVLDPIIFPSLDISGGGGAVAFDQHYTDCHFHLLSAAKVLEKTKIYFDKKQFDIEVTAPVVIVTSQYNFSGRLVILPIQGSGGANITIVEPHFFIELKLSEYQKGGKSHLKVEHCHEDLTFLSTEYQFDNLFHGSKEFEAAFKNSGIEKHFVNYSNKLLIKYLAKYPLQNYLTNTKAI